VPEGTHVLLCGNPAMIEDVRARLESAASGSTRSRSRETCTSSATGSDGLAAARRLRTASRRSHSMCAFSERSSWFAHPRSSAWSSGLRRSRNALRPASSGGSLSSGGRSRRSAIRRSVVEAARVEHGLRSGLTAQDDEQVPGQRRLALGVELDGSRCGSASPAPSRRCSPRRRRSACAPR
jgi:hypothetical protein